MSQIKVTPANITRFEEILWNEESAQIRDWDVEESGERFAVIYKPQEKTSVYITDTGCFLAKNPESARLFPRYEVSVYSPVYDHNDGTYGRCHCLAWDNDVMDFLRQHNIIK